MSSLADFADFVNSTGPEYLRGPRDIVKEAVDQTYLFDWYNVVVRSRQCVGILYPESEGGAGQSTPSDIEKVEGYLAHKYGFSSEEQEITPPQEIELVRSPVNQVLDVLESLLIYFCAIYGGLELFL